MIDYSKIETESHNNTKYLGMSAYTSNTQITTAFQTVRSSFLTTSFDIKTLYRSQV